MVWVVVLVSRPRPCPCTGGSMTTTTSCSMGHLRSKLLRPPQKASGPSSSSSLGTGRRPPLRLYTYQGRESFLVLNKDTSSSCNSSIHPSIRIKVGRHSHSSSPTLRFVAMSRYLPTATVPAIRLRCRYSFSWVGAIGLILHVSLWRQICNVLGAARGERTCRRSRYGVGT